MLNTFLVPVVEQMNNIRFELVMNSGFNKMELLATHLIHLFSCWIKCLAKTSYPKDAHWSGHQDHPDLSPPAFFLWGYLKKRVLQWSQILEDLKQNIRQEINRMSKKVLSSVVNAVFKRAQIVIDSHATSINLTDLSFKRK